MLEYEVLYLMLIEIFSFNENLLTKRANILSECLEKVFYNIPTGKWNFIIGTLCGWLEV